MLKAIQSGRSGLWAQQLQLDSVANNLSNINTTGYKKSETEFAELLRQSMADNGIPVLSGAGQVPEVGGGVKLTHMSKVFTQGDLQKTGRELDLAIEGDGFFTLQAPGGETLYTRDGTFALSKDGKIVNSAGYQLLITKSGEPVKSLEDVQEIKVDKKGNVTVVDSKGEEKEAGQIVLRRFENPKGLLAAGQNMFKAGSAAGEPVEEGDMGVIHQGYLEKSNVDILEEMTRLIEAQKAYSLNARTVRTADEMWGMVNNLRK